MPISNNLLACSTVWKALDGDGTRLGYGRRWSTIKSVGVYWLVVIGGDSGEAGRIYLDDGTEALPAISGGVVGFGANGYIEGSRGNIIPIKNAANNMLRGGGKVGDGG